jgi:lipopolysaccharide/colanic/teichoic acid biosynthesis glycosyltransferase
MQASQTARAKAPDIKTLKPVRTLRNMYSEEQSANAIHRERLRADRTNQEFSLVLFRVPRSIGPSRTALRLARTVLSRSRGTDEVGWFDEETVCAILPGTTCDGAGRFADNVLGAMRDSAPPPQVILYSYPSAWFVDGIENGHPGHTLPQHIHRTPAVDGAAEITRDDLVPFVVDGVKSALKKNKHAKPLEILLARPIPAWKRTMDIIGALCGLIIFSPLLLMIAVGIKLTSKGPVLFKQRRAGLAGKPFHICKFRTMCVDAEAKKKELRPLSEQDGPAFKMANDPRITRIGAILRKTSLDELPQFWNVLKGDMSLVGPRPLPIDEQGAASQWQQTRLDVTPGLTCIWQITGRSKVSFAEWVRMDVAYIRSQTLMTDLKILLKTVPAVLMRKGAR